MKVHTSRLWAIDFFFFFPELDINAGAIALVSEDHVVSQWCKDTQTLV